MQRTAGHFSAWVNRCARNKVAQANEIFGRWVSLPEGFGGPVRNRIFTPSRTFWLFLSQALDESGSCREALRRFQAWLLVEKGQAISPSTAAYCTARGRLRLEDIQGVAGSVAGQMERLSNWLWCGRKVGVVDGTGLSMPDTPDNQEAWPQPKRAKPGCGFPVMRATVLFSLASGAITGLGHGPLSVHERTLLHRLWDLLAEGEVLLGDRGFCGFADFYWLSLRGVDCVMRKNARRKNASVVRRLGKRDHLVTWIKSGVCPKWLEPSAWLAMPESIVVREIEVIVRNPGFRTQRILVVTTLLDPKAYPARSLSDLYLRRWRAELFLKDMKITMGIDALRCKSREMVEKELWMAVVAYNLIRAVMLEAAGFHDVPLDRISFKGTVCAVRQWAPAMTLPHLPKRKRPGLYESLLEAVARDKVPERPGRLEPRARKRRPKAYQLLNKPRQVFREISHRNHYQKALN